MHSWQHAVCRSIRFAQYTYDWFCDHFDDLNFDLELTDEGSVCPLPDTLQNVLSQSIAWPSVGRCKWQLCPPYRRCQKEHETASSERTSSSKRSSPQKVIQLRNDLPIAAGSVNTYCQLSSTSSRLFFGRVFTQGRFSDAHFGTETEHNRDSASWRILERTATLWATSVRDGTELACG